MATSMANYYAASCPVPPEIEPFPPFPVEKSPLEDESPTTATTDTADRQKTHGNESQDAPAREPQSPSTLWVPVTNTSLFVRARVVRCAPISSQVDARTRRTERAATLPEAGRGNSSGAVGGKGMDSFINIGAAIAALPDTRPPSRSAVPSGPPRDDGMFLHKQQPPSSGASEYITYRHGDGGQQFDDSTGGEGRLKKIHNGTSTTEAGNGTMNETAGPRSGRALTSPTAKVAVAALDLRQKVPLLLHHGQGSPSIWEEAQRVSKQSSKSKAGKY